MSDVGGCSGGVRSVLDLWERYGAEDSMRSPGVPIIAGFARGGVPGLRYE